MLEQLITTNKTIALDACKCPLSMLFMARMPRGVAAPFIPSRFALKFVQIKRFVSFERLSFLKSLFTMGEISFVNRLDIPVFSKMEKMPVQTAYIPHKLIKSEIAFEDATVSVGSIA